MSQITIPYKFTPRPYQLDLMKAMDSGYRRAFLVWSRRAGKDKICFNYMVKCMFEKVGTYYYFFPTYEQGRKALWEQIGDEGFPLIDHIPKSEIKSINKQQMSIELKNGSIFRVVAADSVEDSIVGTNPQGMVFSEFAMQDPAGWVYMSPVARQNPTKWVIFNTTPRGKNHAYTMFERITKAPERWYTSVLTIDQLGIYSDEQKQRMLEDAYLEGMSDDDIQQEYYCSWTASIKGSFYSEAIEQARKQGRVGQYDYDDSKWVDTFWDLGINDSTAIWFRQLSGNRIIFVDYFEDQGKPLAHYVQVLKDKGYRFRTHWLPHDGNHNKDMITAVKTIREMLSSTLEAAGISSDVVCTPRLPINDGIAAVRKRFPLYYFNEGLCEQGIKCLEAYHKRWDPKRRTFMREPVHDWSSHGADALRTEALAEEAYEDKFNQINKIKVNADFSIFD